MLLQCRSEAGSQSYRRSAKNAPLAARRGQKTPRFCRVTRGGVQAEVNVSSEYTGLRRDERVAEVGEPGLSRERRFLGHAAQFRCYVAGTQRE